MTSQGAKQPDAIKYLSNISTESRWKQLPNLANWGTNQNIWNYGELPEFGYKSRLIWTEIQNFFSAFGAGRRGKVVVLYWALCSLSTTTKRTKLTYSPMVHVA